MGNSEFLCEGLRSSMVNFEVLCQGLRSSMGNFEVLCGRGGGN